MNIYVGNLAYSVTEDDLRPSVFFQVQVSTDEIGVEVCFEDIFDLRVVALGAIEVRLNFSQRVKDRRFTITLDIIGRVGQASGIYLLYIHNTTRF